MRLLYISLGYEPNDFYDEFCHHFETSLYKGVEHAKRFKPDHIHLHAGAINREELSRIKTCQVSQFTGDIGLNPLEPILRCKDLVDITFLTGKEDRYDFGNIQWMPEALPESQANPIREDVTKITFIGNLYSHFPEGNNRLLLCQRLAEKYPDRFQVYGSFPDGTNCKGQTDYKNTGKIYNNSYIGIAHDNFVTCKDYFTQRYLGVMANTLCIGKRFKGADKFFKDGENIVFYDTLDEMMEKVAYYLANPTERLRIAKNGRELVLNNYMYSHWVKRFKKAI